MMPIRLASFAVLCLCLWAVPVRADLLPGLGALSGKVAAPRGAGIVPVYAHNAARNVGYAVFAVDGTYRAVNLFPGRYEVRIRKHGFDAPPVTVEVPAGGSATADLVAKAVKVAPNYVGSDTVPEAKVLPYDTIYPAGPGRQIVERTCIVCHGVNFLPNNILDRDGWDAAVRYMTDETAWHNLGIAEGNPSLMDPARLPTKDRDLLLDYLARNFGPESEPRVVQQEREPTLDPVALAKAQFIEYRFPNTKEMPRRWTQEVHFDRDGNVWVTERGSPPSIVRVDPRTGVFTDFLTPDPKSSPHGLAVDIDGTVWWAGRSVFLAHLDPKTGKTDQYPVTKPGLHGHTPVFDSKGDIWFSMLPSNKLGHWSRATDSITYWETPSPRGRPYGLIVDHSDKVWYVEYHTDAVTRFDPETKKFTRFPIKSSPAALRRLGVDSKNVIWYGVYGTAGKKGKLGRLDPQTGAVVERELPIDFSNPYDAWADPDDNIWASADNYFVKFDQKTETFTTYPMPERTDQPKIMITREGAIWFTPRDAGLTAGYGGAASVLYPDKDKITTLAAYYAPGSSANHLARYRGPATPVTGAVKQTRDGAQNPEMAPALKAPAAARGGRGPTEGGLAD